MGFNRGVSDQSIRRRVTISGRVQGVFFRDSLRRHAESRGVAGWAHNRSDGAVEAVFEGRPEDVERMIEFAKTGPRQAEVDRVDVRDEDPEGLTYFEIR
jgi:acylphosphatase